MGQDLVDEIEEMINTLTKSGFFNLGEIMEILEDQFMGENIDFSNYTISLNDFDNTNFNKLEKVFNKLSSENIVTIHNCGYDIQEGVNDAFELFTHLKNNNFNPIGFCFYTFENIEQAIYENKLKITYGDFENSEDKALEIGKIIFYYLKQEFNVNWDEDINSQIEINPFNWDKSYDDKEYEIEGAFETFRCNNEC